jgi:uncharacterized protein (DUF697 family)
MTRKKRLPNAIVRPSVAEGEVEAINPHRNTAASELTGPPDQAAVSPAPGAENNVIDIASKRNAPSVIVANDPGPALPNKDDVFAARRRSVARAIVERYANFSAIGGVIPLPILNVVGVTAIMLRMLKVLSRHYGVPFERDRARSFVAGLMGGIIPTGLAAVTTSTLVYVVPGSNLLGLAVSSIAASTCARAIGGRFIEHFESGAGWRDIPIVKSR